MKIKAILNKTAEEAVESSNVIIYKRRHSERVKWKKVSYN